MNSQIVQAVSAAVAALATVAILIATCFYVAYTRRLWEQTRRAAEHTSQELQLTTRQIELAAREIEARLRPYLTTRPRKEWQENDQVRFRFALVNKGPVPARIRSVRVQCWIADDEVPMRQTGESVLFPGGERKTPWNVVPAPVKKGRVRWRIGIRVEYADLRDGKSYVTEYTKRWNQAARAWVNDTINVT